MPCAYTYIDLILWCACEWVWVFCGGLTAERQLSSISSNRVKHKEKERVEWLRQILYNSNIQFVIRWDCLEQNHNIQANFVAAVWLTKNVLRHFRVAISLFNSICKWIWPEIRCNVYVCVCVACKIVIDYIYSFPASFIVLNRQPMGEREIERESNRNGAYCAWESKKPAKSSRTETKNSGGKK